MKEKKRNTMIEEYLITVHNFMFLRIQMLGDKGWMSDRISAIYFVDLTETSASSFTSTQRQTDKDRQREIIFTQWFIKQLIVKFRAGSGQSTCWSPT